MKCTKAEQISVGTQHMFFFEQGLGNFSFKKEGEILQAYFLAYISVQIMALESLKSKL